MCLCLDVDDLLELSKSQIEAAKAFNVDNSEFYELGFSIDFKFLDLLAKLDEDT